MRKNMRKKLAMMACLALGLLSACGFQLRGKFELPFESMYVNVSDSSVLGAELKRNLAAGSNTKILSAPQGAQAVFNVLGEQREKTILSLNSAGQVREFQLRLRFSFSVTDGKAKVFMPPTDIVLTRDITFNDSQVLAKESEE